MIPIKLKHFVILHHLLQNVRVQESTASCNSENKGLLRMANLHLEFCNGKAWVRLSEEMVSGKCCNLYFDIPVQFQELQFLKNYLDKSRQILMLVTLQFLLPRK